MTHFRATVEESSESELERRQKVELYRAAYKKECDAIRARIEERGYPPIVMLAVNGNDIHTGTHIWVYDQLYNHNVPTELLIAQLTTMALTSFYKYDCIPRESAMIYGILMGRISPPDYPAWKLSTERDSVVDIAHRYLNDKGGRWRKTCWAPKGEWVLAKTEIYHELLRYPDVQKFSGAPCVSPYDSTFACVVRDFQAWITIGMAIGWYEHRLAHESGRPVYMGLLCDEDHLM